MGKQEFYNGKEIEFNAVCYHCGKDFGWDEYDGAVYRNKFLCQDCYDMYYVYCNGCGELNKYVDMDEDIYCKGCVKQ